MNNNNKGKDLARDLVKEINKYTEVNSSKNKQPSKDKETRKQFSSYKKKKFFNVQNYTSYASKFQALVSPINSATSYKDTYIRVLFAKYLEYVRKQSNKDSSKYKQAPKNNQYQKIATSLGCEFANSKFIFNFIEFVNKKKSSFWKNSKSRKNLFLSLQEGSIGNYFTNPTFGDILGFHMDFYKGNQALSQTKGMEKLQSFCMVDDKRRVFQFAFKIKDEGSQSMATLLE